MPSCQNLSTQTLFITQKNHMKMNNYFGNRIVMARHGFGEYKYFDNPLPPAVAELRNNLYPPLAAVAIRWIDALKLAQPFPSNLRVFTKRCHDAGQTRPTPLLLRYGPGD